ncbi:MAG: hypothetical protein ACC652_05880 [Acidimicrobiales bacterium]
MDDDHLTARDHFAAQALMGLICTTTPRGTGYDEKSFVEQAYKFADAMMAARRGHHGGDGKARNRCDDETC